MLTPTARPLSDMQLSMLSHEAIVGRPIYNMPWAVRIVGEVDVQLLDRALLQVVRRHRVLCARYDSGSAFPVPDPAPLLQTITYNSRAEALTALARLWATPIDVAVGVPLRALLAQVAEAESYFALSVHHVAGDSWSFGLLVDEVGRTYAALRGAAPAAEPPPAPDFFDHAEEERSRTWDAGFWRQFLGDARPTPYPRTEPVPDEEHCTLLALDLGFGADDTRRIRSTAREARVSPAAVLFAAVSIAVGDEGARASTLGVPAVLRDTRAQQETMGPLLNTLPVHTAWDGASTGVELAQAHARSMDAALAHKDVPYSRILKAAGFRRRPGSAPPFLHAVNIDTEAPRLRLPGLRTETIPTPPQWAVFPAMWEFGWGAVGNVRGILRASRDAFTQDQAAICVDSFRAGLDRVLGGR